MPKVHHYMVDYLDEHMNVVFANDREITSLTAAKSLASKTSKKVDTGAYVVAYATSGSSVDATGFVAIGHISFYEGRQSETDGVVI